jgi:hypothetical protein
VKEVNIPFSLFDFFAILIPGAVGLFGIYLLLNPQLTIEVKSKNSCKSSGIGYAGIVLA